MVKYLKKDNTLLKIDMDEFSLSLTFFDLNKKEFECKYFYSEEDINDEIRILKNDYEPFEAISEELKKEIEHCKQKRDYQIQVYKKDSYHFIIVIEKDLSLVIMNFKKLTEEALERKEYSSITELQKAIKEIPKEYNLETEDTLDDMEYDALYFTLKDLLESEDNSLSYESQFSTEFPFFGAGNATYFEYIALTIYFESEPSKKVKKKILGLLPTDFNAKIEEFDGQSLNLYMEYGYEGIASIYDDNFDELNTNIEKALIAIHKFQPIFFAYRNEDTEAAGTEFSKWHTTSGKVLEDIVSEIETKLNFFRYEEIQNLKDTFKEIHALYGKNKKQFKSKQWNPTALLKKK